jgi:hypothetical protein
MPRRSLAAALLPLFALAFAAPAQAATGQLHILGGNSTAPVFVNYVVGAELLYNSTYLGTGSVIANVEAGHPWSGHVFFDRNALGISATPAFQINVPVSPAAPDAGQVDFHATMVSHVLVGAYSIPNPSNPSGPAILPDIGLGMAPKATLWTGAIASEYSTDLNQVGSFNTTDESFRTPYVAFFTGTGTPGSARADVINSVQRGKFRLR